MAVSEYLTISPSVLNDSKLSIYLGELMLLRNSVRLSLILVLCNDDMI
jgi:hypothetical protein